jgi:Concanavalin A-like lectin/glucanases superfamily/Carbohydrate binding domain
MTLRLLVGLLVVASVPCLAANVDLSRPFTPDKDTICLLHLDNVASGQVLNAITGKTSPAAGAVAAIGKFGGALGLNGTGGWVDVTGLPKTAPRDGITVECWVKFNGNAGGDIICRNMGYMMRIGSTVTAYFGIDGKWRTVSGVHAVPVGRWTHLAITYDRASKQVRIYIDGALDVTRVPKGITAGVLDAGEPVMRLGTNTWSASGSTMNGKLDEVRISSVARTYAPLHPAVAPHIPADTNLVGNPSFESGMYGWRITGEGNGLRLWHIEHGGAAQGQAYLRASTPHSGSIISYPFTIARGQTCTMSASMRADRPCEATLRLQCTDTGGSRPGHSQWFRVAQKWQRVSTAFTIPADWPTDRAYVEIGAPRSGWMPSCRRSAPTCSTRALNCRSRSPTTASRAGTWRWSAPSPTGSAGRSPTGRLPSAPWRRVRWRRRMWRCRTIRWAGSSRTSPCVRTARPSRRRTGYSTSSSR